MLYREKDKSRLRRNDDFANAYNEIMERDGPLKRSNNIQLKDIFLLALAFGYIEDVSIPIENDDKFLKASNFEDVLPVLINALCLEKNDGDINSLSNDDSVVFLPSEEYANAGFEILRNTYIRNEDAFIDILRLKILEMNNNNSIIKKLDELKI